MKKQIITSTVMAVSATVLCIALAGCSSTGTSLTSNANTNTTTKNTQYMSQVNVAISDLDSKLDDFVDAVSRGDTVGMRTQADRAMKSIDTIEGLEATDEISDVKTKYDQGCESLKKALNEYVTLYTSGAAVTQDSLATAQKYYDEGVAALKEADSTASSKN